MSQISAIFAKDDESDRNEYSLEIFLRSRCIHFFHKHSKHNKLLQALLYLYFSTTSFIRTINHELFLGRLLPFIFVACAFAGTARETECPYDYEEVFVFANNKKYDPTALPFYYTYDAIQAAMPITTTQLEAQRQDALNWLQTEYGIPKSAAVYDPVTHITTYPGYGYVTPVFFNDSYSLISSTDNQLNTHQCYFLATVEFTFMADPAANFTYGGKWGQLMDTFGASKQVVPGDGISTGYYYILRELGRTARIERKVSMRSWYPNRSDLPWRSHQFMLLHDDEWGNGQALLELQVYPNAQGKYVSQIWGTWRFGEPYNIYSELGIN